MQGEIGLTYDELSVIGSLRKPGLMGPYAMFEALLSIWSAKYSLDEVTFVHSTLIFNHYLIRLSTKWSCSIVDTQWIVIRLQYPLPVCHSWDIDWWSLLCCSISRGGIQLWWSSKWSSPFPLSWFLPSIWCYLDQSEGIEGTAYQDWIDSFFLCHY